MAVLSPEQFEAIRLYTRIIVGQAVETGQVPAVLGEPLTVEKAEELVDQLLDKHKVTISNATVDFAFGLVGELLFPDQPVAVLEAAVSTMTGDDAAGLLEQIAISGEQDWATVKAQREAFVTDLKATGVVLIQGALATALTLVLGPAGPAATAALTRTVDLAMNPQKVEVEVPTGGQIFG
jgi:hypothetical protein